MAGPMPLRTALLSTASAFSGPTSPCSAPVLGADTIPIVKLDLDAVCDRLNISTREFVKKLGQKDRFNLEEIADTEVPPARYAPGGEARSSAMGFRHSDHSLGVSPQVISSLVGSQGRPGSGSFQGGLAPSNTSMGTSPITGGEFPMSRSPSGFGFVVGKKQQSPTRPTGLLGSERAPLLGVTASPRPSSSPVVSFLSQEFQLPRSRKSSLLGGHSSAEEQEEDARRRAATGLPFGRRVGSFPTSRSHLQDPALLHSAAFIIPSGNEGLSVVAVPQMPERIPLKKRLRLPKIPPEIQSVELLQRMETELQKPKVYLIVKFARPFFGWFVLLTGVVMMATVGPISDEILKLQVNDQGVSGFLLGSWNAQGLILCFSLCAIVSWLMGDWTESTYRYFFSLKGLTLMMLSGIISGAGSGCWTLSFKKTSVEQSYLFNSFHPTLIILCRLLSLQPVYIGEGVGLLLGLVGASVSALTPDDKHSSKLFGDALAFMSSISLCFYLTTSKRVRPHVPLPAMLTVVCFFSAMTQTFMALAVESNVSFDSHPTHGVFGYLHPTYFHWWLFMLLVTSIGQAGYIGALKYLNAVVVSICMTTEPVMAMLVENLIDSVLGQEMEWPTWLSIAGGLLIVLGSAVVSYFSKNHADGVEVDVSEEAETFAIDDTPRAYTAID